MTATTTSRWTEDLEDVGLVGLVNAVLDPLAHLAEATPTGTPGSYWPMALVADADVEVARDRAVRDAMGALEKLLVIATRPSRYQDVEKDLRTRMLMLGAIDRALADPRSGYLKRLRIQRSALLRQRIGEGASVATLSDELGITETRVRSLVANNRKYVSADRLLALEALREQGVAKRAQAKAAREAAKSQAAADRLAARATEGRVLAALIAGGATREGLMTEFGYGRQKLAGLLADAARVDAGVQA